jgi:hypothetical protein
MPFSNLDTMTSLDTSTLFANRKCLLICSAVAIASMQYGIDTAAVGGLQAMPGFLAVFGHEERGSVLGYGIDVRALLSSSTLVFGWGLMDGCSPPSNNS